MDYLIRDSDSTETRLEKARQFQKLTYRQRMSWLIEVTNRLLDENPDLANQEKDWPHAKSVQILELQRPND